MLKVVGKPIVDGKAKGVFVHIEDYNKYKAPIILGVPCSAKYSDIKTKVARDSVNTGSSKIVGVILGSGRVQPHYYRLLEKIPGANLSIPIIYGIDLSLLRSGDKVSMHCNEEGIILVHNVDEVHVATAVVMGKDCRFLLLRRSQMVGSYRGFWAGVSGYVEEGEEPAAAAMREVYEETGIDKGILELLGSGAVRMVRYGNRVWVVHPFCFMIKGDVSPSLDWEHVEFRWVRAEDVKKYRTVPKLLDIISEFAHRFCTG